ncbi:S1C family serine protease [Maridesulfovibrio ferrireducens]|uniref:S1C family serine protease n=1 Tax=Maridesulfovibrio ferrireducens TaxID=246191 RepID=UPI0026F04B2A|nr:S1C family serine protease [Maridesulfovibrio ferrireducens]
MRLKFLGLLLLIMISVAGCKTAGTGKGGDTNYSMFFTPADHITQLVQQKNLLKAEQVWVQNKAFFNENPETRPQLEALASSIKLMFQPKLTASKARVDSITWPAPVEQWPIIEDKLTDAGEMIATAASESILTVFNQVPAELAQLQSSKAKKTKIITDGTAAAFQKYPLLTGKSFFEIYPVKLNNTDFLDSQADFFTKTILAAKGTGVPHLMNTYGPDLSENFKNNLGAQYYKNALRRVAGKSTPSLRAIIKAFQSTTKAGFDVAEIPDCKIAFVRVTSKTMMKQHGIEFGLGIDVDMPIQAEQAEAHGMFNSQTAKDADIIILINEAVSKINRKTTGYKAEKSKLITGYRETYNNKYDKTQMIYQNAQMANNGLQFKINQFKMQGLGGALALMTMQSEIDLNEKHFLSAQANATNTPRMLNLPVYQKYNYKIVTVKDAKQASVQYYIIDRRNKAYYENHFDITQQRTFKVAYGVQDEDPEANSILSKFKTEQDLENYEKQPVSVNLSDILGHYASQRGKDKKYTNIAKIQKSILHDRNKALAEFYSNKYDSDTGNDPRFDSVVVVFNPQGGMGSGFFVTDDVILTNFHVVEGSQFAEMKLHNNMETFGKVMVYDMHRDLALIKIQTRGKPVTFYSKKSLPAGVTLEAIGHPEAYPYTITRGVFSAYRNLQGMGPAPSGRKVRYIQTDAPINHGNSGGPLFYKDKLVGVNTWGLSKQATEGLNFSVHYAEIIDFLKQNGINYRK